MKFNIIKSTVLLLIITLFINEGIAQSPYYFFPGTSSTQRIEGNNGDGIIFYSNDSYVTKLKFSDKEGTGYGYVYGGGGNGEKFGLRDGDGDWSYKATKDDNTAFFINGTEMMRIKSDGNVDICGIVRAAEVVVEDDWCDFVFEPEYCLTTLEEEEEFIKLYSHLSNFESAKAMNGRINVNDIFKRQQIQIEENVLHLIELNKENEMLQLQVNDLEEEVTTLTDNYEEILQELAKLKKQLQ